MRRPFRLILIAVLVTLFAGLLYFNSLGNEFTNWDDGMIYANPVIRQLTWEGVKRIFTYERANMYQPVRVLSYALDYHFWKLNPLGYHITNILFYILTCIMVFFGLERLSIHFRPGEEPNSHVRVGLFGGLLFAALPVHVEAVTWLAARKEVLQGFFFFLAFYLYLRAREEDGRKRLTFLGMVLLFMLVASLSKPSAVVFPAVLLIYEVSVRKTRWVGFLKDHWPFFVVSTIISLIFICIVIKVMLDAGGVKAYRGGNFFSNLLLSFYLLIENIRLLIFTINYSAAYDLKDPGRLLGLVLSSSVGITLLLSGLAIWSLKRTKVIFFAFFFFVVTLFPYLNIIPISTLLADRYVFIASFSYCFLLGVGFDKFFALRATRYSEEFFKILSTTVFLLLLSGYSFMTFHQNRIWENSYTLWADAVEKQPESNTANALMGVVYMDLGMNEKALRHLEKAVQALPYDYESRNNLGIVHGRLGEFEKELKELLIAEQLKPDQYAVRVNLAVHFARQKEYDKAGEVLKNLINKNPRDGQLHYRLAMIYKEMEDYDSAIFELTRARELAPGIITPYEELGNIYVRLNDMKRAKDCISKAIESVPSGDSKAEALRWIVQDLEAR